MKIAATASVGVLVFSLVFSPANGQAGDYLTSEGKLLNKLEVKVQEGGITFPAAEYGIEPDGSWTSTSFIAGKVKGTQQGTLSKDDLGKLAKELARYDLKGLKSGGPSPIANSGTVTISFGDFGGMLTTPPPGASPAPDPNTMAGRFGGIVTAVEGLLGRP